MEVKLIVFLGVLAFCVAAPSDVVESSTSTSVSVSTVTRKVTSRSFSRPFYGVSSQPNDTQTVTEGMLKAHEQDQGKLSTEESDAVTKPQKIKKKILASNFKNMSEKAIFPGEKHEKVTLKPITNVTETTDGGKPNSSDSAEDEVAEEAVLKSENMTQKSKKETSPEMAKASGAAVEGRSLEDRSSEENVNVNPKAKTKAPPSTTIRTTSGYSYETFGGLQKVLNNNYLNNNEGYEKGANVGISRPTPPATLPVKKSPPISRDNSLKNAIRFESEYYGPTGQTDWVPIIPEKLPVRHSATGAQHFGSKMKPSVVEKSNRTTERNPIVFSSGGTQTANDSNAIPVQTTIRVRANFPTRSPTEWGGGRPISTTEGYPLRHVNKFRGTVRYKQANSTVRIHNETVAKRNMSLEIPATGAPWTLATLGKSTAKPVGEETTEISVVSSTNHTTKSQKAVDGGLVVPPENVKMENVTKEPHPKIIVPSSNVEGAKQNKSEIADLSKVAEESQGWIPVKMEKIDKLINNTEPIVLKTVTTNQRNKSISEVTKLSTPFVETTSELTTEEATATETIPSLTTHPKLLSVTTESSTALESSSQSGREELLFAPVTVAITQDEGIVTTIEAVTLAKASPSSSPAPTTLKEEIASEENTETLTEAQPITLASSTSSEGLSTVPLFSQKAGEFITGEVTSIAPPTTPMTVVATTSPKLILIENVTMTSLSTESGNPVPTATVNTTTETFIVPKSHAPPLTTGTTTTVTTTTTTTTTSTTTTATPHTVSTTMVKSGEGKMETTEEGIYYKNYIPTTVNPHVEITEENVPAYLRLTVQARDWEELCRLKEDLRDSIIKMLGGKNVSAESVHFLNLNDKNCMEKISETRGDGYNGTLFLPVNMFLMDKNGDFDKNLSEAFLTLWGRRGLDFELPIRKVDFVTPIVNLTELADPPLGGSVVAAIVISCVAGICVILLGVLFVIMKRRQKRFNYGQRCTPVSLDAYSLDSVSIYNSVRRKGMRASKRSYGNAAFDDPEVPTHPMNFAGLANFSSDKDQLYEEFSIIPQVYPKVEELPAGAETKNRYANIIPLPETRVHLTVKDGDPLSDYINANYVRGLKGAEKLYIACQAPMESTIEDFWRMVWEQQCRVILMVTDLQENGIEKCADYLPPNEVTDNIRLFGDFQVTLKKRDIKEKYIISNLKLKNLEANLWREVTHLWYLGWPDQGVPSEANSLIAFLIEARSQMKVQNGATTSSPVVVHCSPGTGRTGTVIACDLCIREYEQSRMVDIPRCVFNLRRDRAGAVQTKDQYAFIYQVLNVYATKLSGGGIESI